MPICNKIPNGGSFHNSGGKYMMVSESERLLIKPEMSLVTHCSSLTVSNFLVKVS